MKTKIEITVKDELHESSRIVSTSLQGAELDKFAKVLKQKFIILSPGCEVIVQVKKREEPKPILKHKRYVLKDGYIDHQEEGSTFFGKQAIIMLCFFIHNNITDPQEQRNILENEIFEIN